MIINNDTWGNYLEVPGPLAWEKQKPFNLKYFENDSLLFCILIEVAIDRNYFLILFLVTIGTQDKATLDF